MVRRREEDDPVTFEGVECVAVTDKAICVYVDDDNGEVWFPRSQIVEEDSDELEEKGDVGTLVVTGWIAKQKGLT